LDWGKVRGIDKEVVYSLIPSQLAVSVAQRVCIIKSGGLLSKRRFKTGVVDLVYPASRQIIADTAKGVGNLIASGGRRKGF